MSKKKLKQTGGAQAIIDYCLNRFCPPLIIGFLLWSHFAIDNWKPYAIMAMYLFAERFHYNVGYAVGYCKREGIAFEIEK
ncbi:hypothetical protein CMO96_00810 [Candidatus Woesebacteria bacterium]|nr:hypothetical protein [Candidatus Woesebacteria bacterium]